MDKNTGFYMETEPKVFYQDNKAITVFRDRGVYKDEHSFHTERVMKIDGKSFYVKSYFPSISKATPTEQLIRLIDSDTKKK